MTAVCSGEAVAHSVAGGLCEQMREQAMRPGRSPPRSLAGWGALSSAASSGGVFATLGDHLIRPAPT